MTDVEVPLWHAQLFYDREVTHLRQTIPGTPQNLTATDDASIGDCYRTAIACILGWHDPLQVPHFVAERNRLEAATGREAPWHERKLAREFLRALPDPRDLLLIDRETVVDLPLYYIASVNSKAGPWAHVVICRGDDVVHDPSGRDDYTLADLRDPNVEVLCSPYRPDPDLMIELWTKQAELEARADLLDAVHNDRTELDDY